MPNWTSNIIRAEGPEADLREFLERGRGPDSPFDFNTIIPMPALLRHTGSGGMTIDGQRVSSWYVIDPARQYARREPDDPPNERLFTPQEEAALRDLGHSNWYGWSVENWGTKWNACEAWIDQGVIETGVVEIRFDTAWAAPFPVFRKLASMFPGIRFAFSWTDEDEPGVTHTVTIRAGEQS